LIYRFDDSGLAGTYENIVFPDEPPLFSGDFVVDESEEFALTPYTAVFTVDADDLGGAEFQRVFAGWDFNDDGVLVGRVRIELLDSSKALIFEDSGESLLRDEQ
jgi:hypothetical protein